VNAGSSYPQPPGSPLSADRLLAALEAAGFSLRTDDIKVLVSPAGKLSQEQRNAITEHRADLLALLVARYPAARALEDADEHLALAANGLREVAGRIEELAGRAPVARSAGLSFIRRWAGRLVNWSSQLDELALLLSRVVKEKDPS
jgi:hypothetical protein